MLSPWQSTLSKLGCLVFFGWSNTRLQKLLWPCFSTTVSVLSSISSSGTGWQSCYFLQFSSDAIQPHTKTQALSPRLVPATVPTYIVIHGERAPSANDPTKHIPHQTYCHNSGSKFTTSFQSAPSTSPNSKGNSPAESANPLPSPTLKSKSSLASLFRSIISIFAASSPSGRAFVPRAAATANVPLPL